MSQVRTASQPAAEVEVDALIVLVAQNEDGFHITAEDSVLDPVTANALAQRLAAVGAKAKADHVVSVPGMGVVAAKRIIAAGRGTALDTDEETRRAIGNAVRALAEESTVAIVPCCNEQAGPATEGALLAAYTFDRFRSKPSITPQRQFTVLLANEPEHSTNEAILRAEAIADGVKLARDLVNTPPGHMRPSHFVTAARQALGEFSVEVDVWEVDALREAGMGGILAVGQGSNDAPRLLRVTYRPDSALPHLALVGKGITFDSGGLSLKPPKSMEWMKADMGGAAAVVGAVQAVAQLGLDVAVTGWAPLAENMPSGTAQRPGDVITMYGGKTVEVLNTDAEGRLVLGDALVRACEEKPDAVLDIATLTGASIVALGSRLFGVMSRDDALASRVADLGQASGDRCWPMPLPLDLRAKLDSPVADMANIAGGPDAGMLIAGTFLADFVDPQIPWAHLDIAGPAFNQSGAHGYTPKGGTGAGVRILLAAAEAMVDGSLIE